MTILLTGSQGFVGTHLFKRLINAGHQVICLGRDSKPAGKPDVIINCAAELTDESKMDESNCILVGRLLEFARLNGVSKFIQIGSSSEYGSTNEARREDMVCLPISVYEQTKYLATEMCLVYSDIHDLDVCVARPFSLYGPGDKPRKLIPKLYQSHLDHKSIELYEGGHDWTYIDDFIYGLMILLNAPRELTKGDIINFGTGVSSTNHQTVAALESALGSGLDVRWQEGRYNKHDVDNWVADISKARTKYGWNPRFSLEGGMKAFVMTEWFKQDKG